jgi:hypothetical protein
MKKKITKIWGVGLVLVLAASLLLSAAPVSAGTLDWGTETIPSDTGYVLANGTDIVDLAVSEDGVMYAVTGTDNVCYKSTNGGVTWSRLSKEFGSGTTEFVSVSLDDSDVVAVSMGTTIWLSTNGGSTWGDLGTIAGDVTTCSDVDDLAVSAADGSTNYIGVAGDNGTVADVWWFNAGASAPKWHDTADEAGWMTGKLGTQTIGAAVEFSPNVASDKVMVAVTANASHIMFQVHSLNTDTWNTPFGSGYPVDVEHESGDKIANLSTAAIAMAPDYLGSDDSMRITFLGINTAGNNQAEGGVYRLKDDSDKAITDDKDVYSVDYDGTNLVAGNAMNNKVYRSDNPMASDPDFSTTSSLKRPSGPSTDKVIVAWRGSDVVAGTNGTASAFSISQDNGRSFNDISFVDTENGNLGTMDDVAVSEDGEVIYMLCHDNDALSLWRNASSWQRVFVVASDTGYIVRVAPDDADAVYVAKTGGKTMYFSEEGGDTKWFTRTAKYDVQDVAVESADVIYVGVYN